MLYLCEMPEPVGEGAWLPGAELFRHDCHSFAVCTRDLTVRRVLRGSLAQLVNCLQLPFITER